MRDVDQLAGDEGVKDVLWDALELHAKKSLDYGSDKDPLTNIRASEEFAVPPWIGSVIRMNDKVTRIKSFLKKGVLANESLEDSLADIVVYAAIALRLYREGSGAGQVQTQENPLYDDVKVTAEKDALNEDIRTLVEYRENLISRREALERLVFVKDVDVELERIEAENVPNYDSIPIVISPAGFIHPLATQCEWFGCKPTGGSSGPWTERELIRVDVRAHPDEERVPAPEDKLPL